jgi:hypothetical protein
MSANPAKVLLSLDSAWSGRTDSPDFRALPEYVSFLSLAAGAPQLFYSELDLFDE